jgi:hypothetical protein
MEEACKAVVLNAWRQLSTTEAYVSLKLILLNYNIYNVLKVLRNTYLTLEMLEI